MNLQTLALTIAVAIGAIGAVQIEAYWHERNRLALEAGE